MIILYYKVHTLKLISYKMKRKFYWRLNEMINYLFLINRYEGEGETGNLLKNIQKTI